MFVWREESEGDPRELDSAVAWWLCDHGATLGRDQL